MDLNATLFGQMITFAIFIWFTVKFIWPMIIKAMDARKKTIADGLAFADEANRRLEFADKHLEERKREAKAQASHIIEEANTRAMQIFEEAKEKARQEGQALIDNAQLEIDRNLNRAKRDLQAQISGLALACASKVLGQEIDAHKHEQLITGFLKELDHG